MDQISKRIIDLDLEHNLGLTIQEVEHIRSHLHTVKASFETQGEWAALVKSAMLAYRLDALGADAKNTGTPTCLICQEPTELVSLGSDRQAYYCRQHRVAIPAPVEE